MQDSFVVFCLLVANAWQHREWLMTALQHIIMCCALLFNVWIIKQPMPAEVSPPRIVFHEADAAAGKLQITANAPR